MTEENKKTEEEIKKEGSDAAGAAKTGAEGADKAADGVSQEETLISDLKSRVEVAEKRASDAEKERDDERQKKTHAQTEAKTAMEREVQATENSVKNRVEATKNAFEKAQQDYEDAYDSGDKKRLIQAQVALNDAQAQMRGAEYNEEQFKVWKERNKGVVVSTGNSRFTKPEQEWIEKNPKFNTDRRFRAATYAADEEAKEKGIVVDSPDYFRHLNEYLTDLGFDVHGKSAKRDEPSEEDDVDPEPRKEPVKKQEKQKSSTAAPPGGSSPGSGGGAKSKIFTMTPEHREAAAFTFPDLHRKDPKAAEEKYAKAQLDIQERRAKGEQI